MRRNAVETRLSPHVSTFREIPGKVWDDLIDNSQNATPFHSKSWLEAWSKSFGDLELFIVVSNPDGTLSAGLPILESQLMRGLLREYHCLPWGCYGSVIVRTGSSPGIEKPVLEQFLKLLGGWRCHKGTLADYSDNCSLLTDKASGVSEAITQVVDLARPFEEIYASFDYSIKKNLKKAERNGVVIRDANSAEAIELYCEMAESIAKKHGRAPYPRELFRNIYQIMVPRGDARFTLAIHNEAAIAGALHLMNNREVFNWLTVCKDDFLEFRPVEAIDAAIIEWAAKTGRQRYNFGASPREATGLIKFKEKWGAIKRSYHVYELQGSSSVSQLLFKLGIAVARFRKSFTGVQC